ncbi:hypothetical protein, partial [Pseudomonas tremae]|uniref:hypothetical protein n=2 Tax=Pseudomonas syringae group TaxID=136849 RepID=UPI0009FA5CE8
KERPILFSAPMVRAILSGQKTVTRRAVKATKAHADGFMMLDHGNGWWPYNAFGDFTSDHEGMEYPIACPYGKPGDRLWVRESWQDVHPVQVAGGRYTQQGRAGIPGPPGVTYQTIYRADGPYPKIYHSHHHPYRTLQPDHDHGMNSPAQSGYTGWTPSIHMPRWASRILLEITDVRVERLQDISEDQARAEGVRLYTDHAKLGEWWHVDGIETYSADPRKSFELLWTSVGGDWNANPWVWVVEFKRVKS